MSSPPPVPPKDKDIPPRNSSLPEYDDTNESGTNRSGYSRPYPPPSFSSSAMHRNSVLALGMYILRRVSQKVKSSICSIILQSLGNLTVRGKPLITRLMTERGMHQVNRASQIRNSIPHIQVYMPLLNPPNRKFHFRRKEIRRPRHQQPQNRYH